MKQRFEVLIFDWDGTLCNSIGWIVACLQQAARASGLPIPPDAAARAVIGLSIQDAMTALFPGVPAERTTALVEGYQRHYFTKQVTKEDLFAGTSDLLGDLRGRGYRLAIATGKSRSGLARALRDTGVGAWFSTTRCADETAPKPQPDMVHSILEQLGARPEHAVMIGDSVHDLQMAQNAGIAAIGVACGAFDYDSLASLRPLACLRSTSELRDLL